MNLNREILEKKWAETRGWSGGTGCGTNSARTEWLVGWWELELVGRPVLPAETGYCLTRHPMDGGPDRHVVQVVHFKTDAGTPVRKLPALEAAAEDPVGGGVERDRKGEERFQDPRLVRGWLCTRSILDFLRATDVG